MKKRMISWLLAVCMVLTLLPVEAVAAELRDIMPESDQPLMSDDGLGDDDGAPPAGELESDGSLDTGTPRTVTDSGACGENLTWELSDDGTLTISGTGEMENYREVNYTGSSSPWFAYATNIKGVVLEQGVTSIGNCAFYYCDKLTNITIPDGVTSIGYSALSYCRRLTSITIPDGVTRIRTYAFTGCSSLTSITIPDSVTDMGACLFSGCSGLTSAGPLDGDYSIKFGWTDAIPDNSFQDCYSLTSVTIPEGITSIGFQSFEHTGLTSVSLPSTLTAIGPYAFSGTGIEELTIPNGVTSIDYCAFERCDSLISVTIPASVTAIGEKAFSQNPKLKNITVDQENPTYCSIDNVLFSKDQSTLISYPTAETGHYKVPDGVTRIGLCAFSYCKLTELSLPDGLTYIGWWAFEHSSLTSINIPDSITAIPDHAFSGCAFTSFVIPEGIETIGDLAFNECTELASVTLPESLTTIGLRVFEDCNSLKSIRIPAKVTSIVNSYAHPFVACTSLTEIAVAEDNPAYCAVDGVLFTKDMTTLVAYPAGKPETTYKIPDSVTEIGPYAFFRSQLTSIDIPKSVKTIGHYAFARSSLLTSLKIPSGVTELGYSLFWSCEKLTSIEIPDSVTTIWDGLFSDCSKNLVISCYAGSAIMEYAIKNNISYEIIEKPSRKLTVSVLSPDEEAITDNFTVTWYNEAGEETGSGSELSGADLDKSYSFEITLTGDLAKRYQQPERQTIAPEDEAECSVQLIEKPPVKTLTLSGRVADRDGAAIQGAAVAITPAGSDAVEVTTGADGGFRADVPYGVVSVAIRIDGYYSKRETLDLTNETGIVYDAGTYTLAPVQVITDRVTLSVTQRRAAEESDGAMDLPLSSLGAMEVSVEGKDSADFEVQGLALAFKPGAVQAGEEITITITDPSGAYCAASATVELDGNRLGSAELTMVQKGSLVLGGVSGPSANLLLFDGNGNCILTRAAEPGLSSGTLEAGSYRAVLIQKSELLRGVSKLDYLGAFGLNAGSDYLLKEIAIADGKITRLADCAVPALDEGRISYTVAEHTGVSTSKSSGVSVGEMLMVRAAYELDQTKGAAVDSLQIVLPEGMSLTGTSATIDGKTAAYTYDAAKREVKISTAGRDNAVVWLCCTPETSGSHSISAFLTLSGGASQPIGAAVVQAENAKLNVPERTGKAEGLTASGKTMPGCTVTLYDNDEAVGTAAANAAGSWNMSFSLAAPVYSYSYHNIYAVISGGSLTKPIQTESVLVTYDKRLNVELTKITMYNTDDSHRQKTTVFDFTSSGSTATPYYRIYPLRYPTFTFKAEFSGDASSLSDVYVVTTNSAGDKTYVKTKYDAASGAWVGTHDYSTFSSAPVAVTAVYSLGDLNDIPYDEEMKADLEHVGMESYRRTVDALTDMVEDTIQISSIDVNGERVSIFLNLMDVDTKNTTFSAHIQTNASFIDKKIGENGLIQDGYTCIDDEFQLWVKEDTAQISVEETYIFLSEGVKLNISAQQQQLGARSNITQEEKAADLGLLSIINTEIGAYCAGFEVQTNESVAAARKIWSDAYRKMQETKAWRMRRMMDAKWKKYIECVKKTGKGFKIIGRSTIAIGFFIDEYDIVSDQIKYRQLLNGNTKVWNDYIENEKQQYYQLRDCGKLTSAQKADYLQRIIALEELVGNYKNIGQSALDEELLRREAIALAAAVAAAAYATVEVATAGGAIAGSLTIGLSDYSAQEMVKEKVALADKIIHRSKIIENEIQLLNKSSKQFYNLCNYEPFFSPEKKQYAPYDAFATPIHDPSGYVYEAVPSNRLEGVTATISSQAGGNWNAAAYDQINPQVTGADGGYYWDVPQGNWKVSFTKAGYENADTSKVSAAVNGWLPVPPPQLEVNVGMVSTAAPAVKQAAVYTDRVEVEFSQYMDIASVRGALSLTQGGAALSGCTVEALDAESNLENTAQYATRFAITPDDTGVLSNGLAVSVSTGAKNYAGKPLASAYTSETLRASVRPTGIAAVDAVSVGLHKEVSLPLTLQPNVAARELVIENLSPNLIGTAKTVRTGADGTAGVSIAGILPGSGMIQITEPVSGLSTTVAVNVSFDGAGEEVSVLPVEAVLSDGRTVTDGMTVPRNAEITLRTNTPGAVIRYTLNDTCPCTQEALTCSGPITIGGSTVLRAAAYKNGVYSSTIRLQLNVEDSGGTHIHSWAASWSSDANGHWHNCTAANCPITTNSGKNAYAAHTSDGGVVTTLATSSTAGVKTFSCTVCKYVIKTETIPAADGSSPGGGSGFSGAATYKVTVPTNIPNGTVTLDNTSARRGDTVTITATPDSGYELASLTVTDANGNRIQTTSAGGNRYTFVMPGSGVTVDAVFAAVDGPDMPTAISFTDVQPGAYYYDAVAWAVEQGVTKGTSATTFSPDTPCTRAQIVTFLWRVAGSPKAEGENPFTDVAPGNYYYYAVLWAVSNGITFGTNADTFSPDTTCTRGQAVTFLYRYEKSPVVSGGNTFTDINANAYYTDAVQWAVNNGVTAGTSATTFSPSTTCTRGQIVTFLYRDMA